MKRLALLVALVGLAAAPAAAAPRAPRLTMHEVKQVLARYAIDSEATLIRCSRKTAVRIDCTARFSGETLYFDDGSTAQQLGTSLDHLRFVRSSRRVWVRSSFFTAVPCRIGGGCNFPY